MPTTIFLAGASGAIGRRLVPLLLAAGHTVTGTTRSTEKARLLDELGVRAVVVDVFDPEALTRAVAASKPDVVIHQLTDLPAAVDPSKAADFAARNAKIRRDGTANLVRAALDAGARHLIAQSIAWAYAPGNQPFGENAPLDLAAPAPRNITVGGVVALEHKVLKTPERLTGMVLRYGHIYGPGTGTDTPDATIAVHVDAAANAALLAINLAKHGIYNVAEPSAAIVSTKAVTELGWDPDFRL